MNALVKAFVLLFAAGVVLTMAAFVWVGFRGISARGEPGLLETAVMQVVRRLAIPRAGRERQNPVASTPEVVAAGMAHYADHCATCHANDGSGQTEMGLGLSETSRHAPPATRTCPMASCSSSKTVCGSRNAGLGTGTPEAWKKRGTHALHPAPSQAHPGGARLDGILSLPSLPNRTEEGASGP